MSNFFAYSFNLDLRKKIKIIITGYTVFSFIFLIQKKIAWLIVEGTKILNLCLYTFELAVGYTCCSRQTEIYTGGVIL